jgi:hypothetical protein
MGFQIPEILTPGPTVQGSDDAGIFPGFYHQIRTDRVPTERRLNPVSGSLLRQTQQTNTWRHGDRVLHVMQGNAAGTSPSCCLRQLEQWDVATSTTTVVFVIKQRMCTTAPPSCRRLLALKVHFKARQRTTGTTLACPLCWFSACRWRPPQGAVAPTPRWLESRAGARLLPGAGGNIHTEAGLSATIRTIVRSMELVAGSEVAHHVYCIVILISMSCILN